MKPFVAGGLSKLLIPRWINDDPELEDDAESSDLAALIAQHSPDEIQWETVIEKKTMERHLHQYNRQSFRAAAESPCGYGLLHDTLKFNSLSRSAQAVLDTGSCSPRMDLSESSPRRVLCLLHYTRFSLKRKRRRLHFNSHLLIRRLLWLPQVEGVHQHLPSGRHLGHYKALIQEPRLLSGALTTTFLNITITRGVTIKRWCNATNVLIEKDIGKPCIHRLRIIHLFEADFNLFLKIVWASRLVKQAVALDLLNAGQHGSVPRRTTKDPITLTQLTTDLCHLLKINLARFDNDATACYDCIIVILGMLVARRCGMPKNAIRTHAKDLLFTKYTVKTMHGVSETNYSGTPFEPLFGTGQGSGASPALWLTLIVILMNTMDCIIPKGMEFASPDGSNRQARLLGAFVDDTSIGYTNPGDMEFPLLTNRLQEIAQTWEQLLHLSGGSLNLKKCSYHILFWEWKAGRLVLRPIHDDDPEIK